MHRIASSPRLRHATAALLLGCAVLARAQTPAPTGPTPAPNPPPADPGKVSFFVTSVGQGKGADLGGLAGADAHCQALAGAIGAGARTWHAYLSTQALDGQPAANARDRIGQGPWFNIRGVQVAKNVSQLHGDTLDEARLGNNLSRSTALTERNELVHGFGDKPNEHDILTGSRPDGTAFSDDGDHTCHNYTRSTADGSAQVGHFDRTGGGNTSWNSAHPSRGCGQDSLTATGGAGLYYCFAIN